MATATKPLIGAVALIRNEADILPAWLAHLAHWADRVVLLDHGSIDGSRDLIRAACARPGWEAWDVDVVGYHQETFTAAAMAHLFTDEAVRWIVPLDADEFLQVASGDALRPLLASVPVPSLRWVNCIVSEDRRHAWVPPWRALQSKSVMPRPAWNAGCRLILGHHDVRTPDGALAPSSYVADLWHFPLRSVAQMRRKLVQGALTLALRGGKPEDYGHYEHGLRLVAGGLHHADLVAWAARYPFPPGDERWEDDAALAAAGWRWARAEVAGVPLISVAHEPEPWRLLAGILAHPDKEPHLTVDDLVLDGTTLRRAA